MKFDTISQAKEWELVIRSECITPRLSQQIVNFRKYHCDGTYCEIVHQLLMRSTLSGNRALLSLLIADKEVSNPLLTNLHANIRDTFDSDPNIFAYVVELASRDEVDRVLLLHFSLPRLSSTQLESLIASCPTVIKNVVNALPKTSSYGESVSSFAPICLLVNSYSQEPSLRKALLQLYNHDVGDSCARDNTTWERPQDWITERKWLNTMASSCGERIQLEFEDMKLMLRSQLWLLLKVLQSLYDHCRSLHMKRELFSLLPQRFVCEEFYARDEITGEISLGPHFIKYMLSLDSVERENTIQNLNRNGSLSEQLLQKILQEGLKMPGGCNAVCEVARNLVFSKKEFCEDDFCVSFIQVIPRFAPLVVEEIFKARSELFRSDPDSCRLMLTFVMRLEDCASRGNSFREANIVTITKWLSEDSNKHAQKLHMVKCVLDDLQMHRYVYEKLSPLMATFFPLLQSSLALPPPSMEQLRVSMSDGRGASKSRVYSKERMSDLLVGFMIVSAISNSTSFSQFLKMESNMFQTWFAKTEPFRQKAIEALSRVYKFTPSFLEMMRGNQILNENRHFEGTALDLMTSNYPGDMATFSAIASVALKLANYNDLKGRVVKVLKNLEIARDKKIPVMMQIVDAVNKRNQSELGKVSLEDLSCCVNDAINALALLGSNQVNEKKRLTKLFDHYLNNCAPDSWRGSFKGAHSVAIFMKYLNYDDIDTAYQVFKERNKDNKKFLRLLKDVGSIYRTSLISSKESDLLMNSGTTEKAIETFLENLDTRLQQEASSSEGKLIAKMGVEWMKKINTIMKVPIAPRNAQFITTLACCKWAKDLFTNSRDSERALVAQVGTGEGKSLIIAMCATYMVKELGKKVHILENNEGLLKKDFAQFKDFYEKFGIKMVDATTLHDIVELKDFHVVYTLRRNLESYYRDAGFNAIEPFVNTVLIVDEVDELIVDDKPNSPYVKPADSAPIISAFSALKAGRGKPNDVSLKYWNLATAARDESRQKRSGHDYMISPNGQITVLENGKPTHYWYLWSEYIAFDNCNKAPTYMTTFYYQSMPYMLSQYSLILGLSGSLGSPAERKYLKDVYGAWNFTVPSFLDTCRQMRPGIPNKCLPVLIDGNVKVYKRKSDQYKAIVDLAVEKASFVPVLIIVNYPEKREMLEACLASVRRKGKSYTGDNDPTDMVQLFAEFDDKHEKMNWVQIVDKATGALNGISTRRITVTDPFGGRGHDFSVRDNYEQVEEHEGMLVITTFIPESERDWIQWKGRTARSDNKGQYAVILREENLSGKEPQEQKDDTFLSKYRVEGGPSNHYNLDIIAGLLEVQDKKKEKQIIDDGVEILRGKRLNELCDKYYLTHKTGLAGRWPSCDNDDILCSFLQRNDSSPQAIQEVCRKLGLNYSSRF